MHSTTMTIPMRTVLFSSRVNPSSVALVPSSQNSLQQSRRYRTQPSASFSSQQPRKGGSPHLQQTSPIVPAPRRHTSTASPTASSSRTPNSTSTSSPSSSPSEPASALDWNSFFRLRTIRRRYNLVSSIATSVTTTASGITVLSTQDADALGTQIFGLDPLVILGVATAGFGALGWLMGPFLGGALWGWMNRAKVAAFSQKEKEFYNRIKHYRVDPSTNSFQNPVPDYYGEKIGSVTDYRHWLKDQRAYNRKRKTL